MTFESDLRIPYAFDFVQRAIMSFESLPFEEFRFRYCPDLMLDARRAREASGFSIILPSISKHALFGYPRRFAFSWRRTIASLKSGHF
jgi:hypothetical protein